MRKKILRCYGILFILLTAIPYNSIMAQENIQNSKDWILAIGSYATADNPGIYTYRFDAETGDTKLISQVRGIADPSYLVFSADSKNIYAVSEGQHLDAKAYAYAFNKHDGNVKKINSQDALGAYPCYINTDRKGKFVVTANYGGGNISVFPIAKDGGLAPASQIIPFEGDGFDTKRQKDPHMHCLVFSPDQKYLFAMDLGTDKIYILKVLQKNNKNNSAIFLDQSSSSFLKLEDGSGPRHLAFHPNGKFAYLINELSGKVSAMAYKSGQLKILQYIESDTSPGMGSKGSADIHISPNGKFLYASNRLINDGIAIFAINQKTGVLTKVGYQKTGIHPRNFVIAPNGKFLLVANRDSNNIQIFEIDHNTGLLTDTKKEIKVSKPSCLKFAGRK